ncbi:hypothetical protein GUJ93_ZPchr0006g40963 [Zizania palustris]|uniref:Uncharacterized protein n=1 Tax=Zizania palustris TaxID=103762 RepID=A0A8J5SZ30_ZIZPA|nr:hypothetical protein GUJ93_ZPchr0006g40963 [Zizania palustris]
MPTSHPWTTLALLSVGPRPPTSPVPVRQPRRPCSFTVNGPVCLTLLLAAAGCLVRRRPRTQPRARCGLLVWDAGVQGMRPRRGGWLLSCLSGVHMEDVVFCSIFDDQSAIAGAVVGQLSTNWSRTTFRS